MNLYPLFRPFIHALPPECAHEAALWALQHSLVPPSPAVADPVLASSLWGINFAHPVGLAAGFDKNADVLAPLSRQGFSFIEAGTVTPLPQEGNDKPRMFRLGCDAAVINRLGFNNQGLEYFVAHLAARKNTCIIGANIGKNKNSDDAVGDYVKGLQAVYPYADYITINISSPNTQGLRGLQKREQLSQLFLALIEAKKALQAARGKNVPLLLKIAPDLDDSDLEDVAEVAMQLAIDGMIVSNTTIKRPRTLRSKLHGEQGGLSGVPLFDLSTEVLARMYRLTGGKIPLIGVGGIASAEDAYKKICSGASLVQLYTALVYQGFGLVRRITRELPTLLARDGFSHVSEAIGVDIIEK